MLKIFIWINKMNKIKSTNKGTLSDPTVGTTF